MAREKPGWIPVIRSVYKEAGQTKEFAGAWVLKRLGEWAPSLRTLAARGVLEKTETARGGQRAYYEMPDRAGVERALKELGAL